MFIVTLSPTHSVSVDLPAWVGTLAAELKAVVLALLRPGRIIAEVEEMRALHLEAGRVETIDPARAAALRQRASRIGLR